MSDRKREWTGIAILLLGAMIWGAAFTAQSVGARYVPAFTFLASRTWLAIAILFPIVKILEKRSGQSGAGAGKSDNGGVKEKPPLRLTLKGGLLCGFFLFAASASQQTGIAYTTTAKSGFITAMYVVIVPIIYAIVRRKSSLRIWISVLFAVTGLYLLCMKESLTLGFGDLITLLCAFLFSLQIMCIDRFTARVGALRLTLCEFCFEAVFATICAILFEHPTKEGIMKAGFAILYAGVMSSAVGYTLQTVGQARVNPAAASIAMSMESVFSALTGWIVLKQTLTVRELTGCAVMFAAIIIAELPVRNKKNPPLETAGEGGSG